MSRYPFSDRIEEYILSCGSSLGNDGSVDAARRHLRSMGRIFHQLKTEGMIGSDNPSQLTVNDIQSFIKGAKPTEYPNPRSKEILVTSITTYCIWTTIPPPCS